MKKMVALGLIVIMLFSLVGCGKEISLNSKENDLVAEYIAGELLEYANHNKWNYQKLNATLNLMPQQPTSSGNNMLPNETTPQQTEPAKEVVNNNAETTTSAELATSGDVMADLATQLGIPGVKIEYKEYTKNDVYPEEKFSLGVKADSGCKLFVFKFRLMNNTENDITANTYASGVSFKLGIGGTTILQTGTIMQNDLIILKDEQIPKEGVYYAVAIFQVPEAYVDSTDITLTAYKSGKEIGKVPGL